MYVHFENFENLILINLLIGKKMFISKNIIFIIIDELLSFER